MTQFLNGDLLEAKVEAFVNTVNTVGVMGKGIALQFKRRFPENFKAYDRACKRDEIQIGKMFVFDNGLLSQPRFIINFPTKRHWRSASKLEYVKAGLEDLVRVVRDYGIRSVAIPALGCSNGGLEWRDVRPLIEAALRELKDVEAFVFEPHAIEESVKLSPLKQPPGLTVKRAVLLQLFAFYTAFGDDLGRLEVQKLAYFVQMSGFDLNLKFVKQKYGPYADALNHVLLRLEGHYITGFGDRQSRSHIQLLPNTFDQIENILADDSSARNAVAEVMKFIDGFETPYGMELLSSVDWVTRTENAQSVEQVLIALQNWNERKKTVFTEHHVRYAWQHLIESGWIRSSVATYT